MPSFEPIAVAIIDDDRALLDSLRQIIDSADGFFCAGAFTSVEQAASGLGRISPDVLLLDIQLPGMSGYADPDAHRLFGSGEGVRLNLQRRARVPAQEHPTAQASRCHPDGP
ncbi:MAG: response regulator [Acidobacteria bacterium]|nr:response regulator [Acidobacteriota bacterium]MBI3278315.1 response regulator [Acidobacteriota bacterium]